MLFQWKPQYLTRGRCLSLSFSLTLSSASRYWVNWLMSAQVKTWAIGCTITILSRTRVWPWHFHSILFKMSLKSLLSQGFITNFIWCRAYNCLSLWSDKFCFLSPKDGQIFCMKQIIFSVLSNHCTNWFCWCNNLIHIRSDNIFSYKHDNLLVLGCITFHCIVNA